MGEPRSPRPSSIPASRASAASSRPSSAPVSRPSTRPSSVPAPRTSSVPPSRASTAPPSSRTSTAPPSRKSTLPAPRRSGSPFQEEIVLPFRFPRAELLPATAYRSTWIVSSLRSLHERGHFDRYRSLLVSHAHEILECVAGTWLSLEIAHAHYAACDRLGLAVDEQVAMGRAVGGRAQGSILATTVKAARGVGVTPWTIAPHFDRLWLRGANGGGAAVYRLGPKEARAEFVGCSLFDVGYFRHAFRGVLLGVGEMFCEAGYVTELPRRQSGEAIYRLQWA